jgi:predicted site-specific integrase-resolvase
VVLDKREASKEQELVNDIISILTVFTSKLYGFRSHSIKKKIGTTEIEGGKESNNGKIQIGPTTNNEN